MDAFFLSSLVSFMVTLLLLVSTTRVSREDIEFRIGESFELKAVRPVFFFVMFVVSVLLLVAVVMLVVGRAHPRESAIYSWSDFLAGRQFVSVVLGLLFGSLFAFWLRDLLWLQPDEKVGSKPILEAVVLAILLLLGAFSDILIAAAYRISQINIAGTQLTFAPAKDGDRAQAGLGSVRQDARSNTLTPRSSSQALGLVASLKDRVRNDWRYMDLLFPHDANMVIKKLSLPPFYTHINDYMQCLSAVASDATNDSYVGEQLRTLLPRLREFSSAQSMSPTRRTSTADLLVRLSSELVERVGSTSDARREVIDKACNDLRSAPWEKKKLSASIDDFFTEKSDEQKSARDDQPYGKLLLAGLLWRLGDYSAAVAELDGWVNAAKEDLHPWLKVRARIYIAIIVEEWLRQPGAPPPRLLKYHLDNLLSTIDLTRPLLRDVTDAIGEIKEDVEKDGFRGRVPAGGSQCSAVTGLIERKISEHAPKDGDWEELLADENKEKFLGSDWEKLKPEAKKERQPRALNEYRRRKLEGQAIDLFLFWLGQHTVFEYRATQTADYYDNRAAVVMKYRNFVLKRDVFCLRDAFPDFAPDIDSFYADVLGTYAEIELANAARFETLPDRDAAKRALERAQSAAILGLQMIKPLTENENDQAKGSFAKLIQPRKNDELNDSLKDARQRAERRLKAL